MIRYDLINKIGREYLKTNIENDEWSYSQALKRPINGHFKLDLRFEYKNISILIETKNNNSREFNKKDKEQLFSYIRLEREYKKYNDIISILYNFKTEKMKLWKNDIELDNEITINSFKYYIDLFTNKRNSKNNVIETTNSLNNDLHAYGIKEDQRSQFVGCLLVALNNGLEYDSSWSTKKIIDEIKSILESKIENDENKRLKTELLIKILDEQNIEQLEEKDFINLLDKIKRNLIPYIDSKTPQGEDLLNLFFTTFNKYVGKKDKNQAYTPNHITDFMCEISNVNKNSRVLDPTCGSGSFLVQAMAKMIHSAGKDEKARQNIKKNQLFGIEKEKKAFGLATTNMLIHEDGKTNIKCGDCFDSKQKKWIKDMDINVVLMNPPFNAQKMPEDCPVNKKKNMDSTKGFYFVKYVADLVNRGTLATILPLSCAIGSNNSIAEYKQKMLKNHTLKAVFSLPNDVFHPGAAVNVCVMLFELGIPHNNEKPTFFGYYKDDGFVKKKNKGRVEKINWESTKKKWLEAFFNLKSIPGFSVIQKVNANDEWLAEAYMETDYSFLTENDFIQTIRDFIAFKVKNGEIHDK